MLLGAVIRFGLGTENLDAEWKAMDLCWHRQAVECLICRVNRYFGSALLRGAFSTQYPFMVKSD